MYIDTHIYIYVYVHRERQIYVYLYIQLCISPYFEDLGSLKTLKTFEILKFSVTVILINLRFWVTENIENFGDIYNLNNLCIFDNCEDLGSLKTLKTLELL